MNDNFSKKLVTSVSEFAKKMIDEHITSMTPKEKDAELERLYLEVAQGKGILSLIGTSPVYSNDQREEVKVNIAPNMKSIPGYDEIEKNIEESKKEQEHIEPPIKQEQDNDPNTASIYRKEALTAVEEDKTIPLNYIERKKEIVEEENIITAEGPSNVKTKILSNPDVPTISKSNDAWSSAGEAVAPGTLNL